MDRQRAGLVLLVLVLSHILGIGVAAIVDRRQAESGAEQASGMGVRVQVLVGAAASLVGFGLFVLLPGPAPTSEPSRLPAAPRNLDAALARAAQQKVAYKRRSEILLQFLNRLSMELRTSLTGVVGYAELVKEDAQRREEWRAASDIDRILVGARSGLDLVEDTLALAALERGDFEVDVDAFQLGTVIHDIIGALRPLGGSLGTRIELESGQLGSVYTDRARVRHILRNVIGRAVSASPGALVRVEVTREGTAEEPWIKIVVTDSGPLLTQGQLEQIFAVSAPESSDTTGPGSSIGLLVARRFAERLGGRLDADADRVGGTRLTLRLPGRLSPDAVDLALGSTRLGSLEVDR